jgi:hypothetical protein
MTTSEMSWVWIAQALLLPTLIAVLVALPFWLKGSPTTGAIVGSGVVFVAVVAFIGREYVTLARYNPHCLTLVDTNTVCH